MHTSIVIHEWGMKLGIFPILSHQIIPWGVGNHSERSKDLIHISHISELHIGNEIRICAKLLFDSRNLRISAFHLMIFLHAIIIVSLGALQKQDWKCFSILTRVLTPRLCEAYGGLLASLAIFRASCSNKKQVDMPTNMKIHRNRVRKMSIKFDVHTKSEFKKITYLIER